VRERVGRATPLPKAMQGRWVDENDPSSELVIAGGEVTCFGRAVDYDYKEVAEIAGAVTVSLRVIDETQEEAFERANLTELVMTSEGEFHAYNANFATEFVRARG
jgi:hypothetical protein